MTDVRPGQSGPTLEYRGPKDLGKADSLYQSALTKSDTGYRLNLLFLALVANPEHEGAFKAILSKIPELAAAHRKAVSRVGESLQGSPADDFVRALAVFVVSPASEQAIACASEASKIGLTPYAVALAAGLVQQWEEGRAPMKSGLAIKLMEILEKCSAYKLAAEVVQIATRAFPHDQALREREKNLLARKYLVEHDPSAGDFRANLQDRAQQEAAQRPVDPVARFDELERHYTESHKLEDFRDLVRALREVPAPRREAALPVLQDGYERFGEREMLWLIREIKLERRWSEVRVHQRMLEESPADASLQSEQKQLRSDVLREHVDHLYEVASSLPPGPDRARRELELARKLFDGSRFEECIKQAQRLKGRPEHRLDAWVIMAKAFVQLGLTPEASACFENVLAALGSDPQGTPERVLEAKYAYAEFLTSEATTSGDDRLANQARKLCCEVMVEDIDYREIRKLSARAEALAHEE